MFTRPPGPMCGCEQAARQIHSPPASAAVRDRESLTSCISAVLHSIRLVRGRQIEDYPNLETRGGGALPPHRVSKDAYVLCGGASHSRMSPGASLTLLDKLTEPHPAQPIALNKELERSLVVPAPNRLCGSAACKFRSNSATPGLIEDTKPIATALASLPYRLNLRLFLGEFRRCVMRCRHPNSDQGATAMVTCFDVVTPPIWICRDTAFPVGVLAAGVTPI